MAKNLTIQDEPVYNEQMEVLEQMCIRDRNYSRNIIHNREWKYS